MLVVRIASRKHAELNGIGAKLYGGRWNSPGMAAVYTASCGALAALEYQVHMTILPANLLILHINVPDTLARESISSIPGDEKVQKQLGDEWLAANETPLLRVPSALVPRQWNLLINPGHPMSKAVQIEAKEPFAFDPRLLGAIRHP